MSRTKPATEDPNSITVSPDELAPTLAEVKAAGLYAIRMTVNPSKPTQPLSYTLLLAIDPDQLPKETQ